MTSSSTQPMGTGIRKNLKFAEHASFHFVLLGQYLACVTFMNL